MLRKVSATLLVAVALPGAGACLSEEEAPATYDEIAEQGVAATTIQAELPSARS